MKKISNRLVAEVSSWDPDFPLSTDWFRCFGLPSRCYRVIPPIFFNVGFWLYLHNVMLLKPSKRDWAYHVSYYVYTVILQKEFKD